MAVSSAGHSVVLNLGLAERGAVIADDDELRLAGSQGLQGRLIAQGVLARLHHQRKARVDGLGRCLNFLGHFDYLIVLLSCTRERKQAAADKYRYTWRHRQRMVAYITVEFPRDRKSTKQIPKSPLFALNRSSMLYETKKIRLHQLHEPGPWRCLPLACTHPKLRTTKKFQAREIGKKGLFFFPLTSFF